MTVGLKRTRARAVEIDVVIAVCVAAVGAGAVVFLQLVGPSLDPAKMSYVHERRSGQARVFHTKWGASIDVWNEEGRWRGACHPYHPSLACLQPATAIKDGDEIVVDYLKPRRWPLAQPTIVQISKAGVAVLDCRSRVKVLGLSAQRVEQSGLIAGCWFDRSQPNPGANAPAHDP